jgi:hypothetical protein
MLRIALCRGLSHLYRACVLCLATTGGTCAGAPGPAARPRRHDAGAGRHPAHRRHGRRLRLLWQGL